MIYKMNICIHSLKNKFTKYFLLILKKKTSEKFIFINYYDVHFFVIKINIFILIESQKNLYDFRKKFLQFLKK